MQPTNPPPFARFDFDLAPALLAQLVAAFDALAIGSLTQTLLDQMPPQQGVYQLYLADKLMYIGKADDSLPKRLGEHLWNLTGRKNVDVRELGFKCLMMHPGWMPSTHEDILIRHYEKVAPCEWYRLGLGNHDPGRNREGTKTAKYDRRYPIKEDFVPPGVVVGDWNARELLRHVKEALPYIFRYETDDPKQWRKGSGKYNGLTVHVPQADLPMTRLLQVIVDTFSKGWQTTFFPGRVILYEENKTYAHQTLSIRKNGPSTPPNSGPSPATT